MIGRRRSADRRGPDVGFAVVGLGNPGAEYDGTRHNVGFEVVDVLARRHHGSWRTSRQRAEVCEIQSEAGRILLAKPQTFMNLAGESVKAIMGHFGIELEELLVVHDELDLPLGTVRLKPGGGTAGHNGLKSVVACLGTRDFVRLRLGIGRPPGRMPGADFVLKRFRSDEVTEAEVSVQVAADMAESWATAGVEATQNRYHADRQ